jgi:hypothetical protein
MIPLLIFFLAPALPAAQTSPRQESPNLKVSDVLFEDYSGGLNPHWEMKPGEEVVMSFRIEGFGRLEEVIEGVHSERINLHYRLQIQDPQGVSVVPERGGDIETELGMQDKDWRPKIDWSARIPDSAPGGDYTVRIEVSDRIAMREAVRNAVFRVMGQRLAAADNLQVRQLEYSVSERGPWSRERYFSPTEAIWVRYRVTGYGVSPGKEVWVQQDWTVLDPDGKVIVTQPDAFERKEQNFYPPRFLATFFTLNLTRPKPGKYTLRIDVRDRIRDQNASFESNFFLRP